MKLDSSVGCFMILLSILGGWLLADPLLNLSGIFSNFPTNGDREFRAIIWFVAAVFGTIFILYGLRTILYLSIQGVDLLRNSNGKPGQAIAITLIICGTACLLGVVGLEYLTSKSTIPPSGIMTSVNSQMSSGNVQFHTSAGYNSGSWIFLKLTAGLIFLAGSVLISLGVWSSIPNPARPTDSTTGPA